MVYVTRYAGDDWTIPFQFLDVARAPISLVGWTVEGAFLIAYSLTPIPLTVLQGRVVIVDAANGSGLFLIPNIVTRDVPTEPVNGPPAPTLPNRLQIKLLDADGKIHTSAILAIKAIKP